LTSNAVEKQTRITHPSLLFYISIVLLSQLRSQIYGICNSTCHHGLQSLEISQDHHTKRRWLLLIQL